MTTPSTGGKARRESIYMQKLGRFTDKDLFTPSPLKRRDNWIQQTQQPSTGVKSSTRFQEDMVAIAAKKNSPGVVPSTLLKEVLVEKPTTDTEPTSTTSLSDVVGQTVDVRELLNASLAGENMKIPTFVDMREELPFLEVSHIPSPLKRLQVPTLIPVERTSWQCPHQGLNESSSIILLNSSVNGRLSNSPRKRGNAEVGMQLLQSLSPKVLTSENVQPNTLNVSGRKSLGKDSPVKRNSHRLSIASRIHDSRSEGTFIVLGESPERSAKSIFGDHKGELLKSIVSLEAQVAKKREELLASSSQLNAEKARHQSEVANVEQLQKDLEQRIEEIRDAVDAKLAEKQQLKKENVRLATEFYDKKRVSEAFQAKVTQLTSRFKEDEQKAVMSLQKKDEFEQKKQQQVEETPADKHKGAHGLGFSGASFRRHRSRSDSQSRLTAELHALQESNAELHRQLLEIKAHVIQKHLEQFTVRTHEAHRRSSAALDKTIHMREACDNARKSADTTIVVDESVLF